MEQRPTQRGQLTVWNGAPGGPRHNLVGEDSVGSNAEKLTVICIQHGVEACSLTFLWKTNGIDRGSDFEKSSRGGAQNHIP